MRFRRSSNGERPTGKHPKASVIRRAVLFALVVLAPVPQSVVAAVDPFAPFPYGAGEAADPRIEALREAMRPETFKPLHEAVITDALFFRWAGIRGYVKGCGGDPTLTTGLPKEGTPATPFRATFESAQAPIRTYIGDGYACTFPARLGPMDLGFDAPAVWGLITYSDGSYWLGEVKGAGNPDSRESAFAAISTPLTPTPAGIGEWGRADGSRVQGEARVLAVPMWPKAWASASVVAFEMSTIHRTGRPEAPAVAAGTSGNGSVLVADASLSTTTAAPVAALPSPAPALPEEALANAPVASPSTTDAETKPATASPPTGPSRLAGFLTSSTGTVPTPVSTPAVSVPPDSSAAPTPRRSGLAGFLEQESPAADRPRHVPQGGFSALVDGRLVAAQADYQEEQRILREREEARRRAEAERLARQEAARRAEQERIAQMERQRAAQEESQSSGFFGAVLGMVAGAAIGAEMGLDANQALEMASTMGDIGRAVETGNASDAMAAQSSVDSLGSRLDAVAPASSVGDGYSSKSYIAQGASDSASSQSGAYASDVGSKRVDSAPRPQEGLASNSFQASRPIVQSQQFSAPSTYCHNLSMEVMSMKGQIDRCVGGGGGAFNSNKELREAEARCEAQWRPRIDAIEAKYRAECGSDRPGGAVGNQ